MYYTLSLPGINVLVLYLKGVPRLFVHSVILELLTKQVKHTVQLDCQTGYRPTAMVFYMLLYSVEEGLILVFFTHLPFQT